MTQYFLNFGPPLLIAPSFSLVSPLLTSITCSSLLSLPLLQSVLVFASTYYPFFLRPSSSRSILPHHYLSQGQVWPSLD